MSRRGSEPARARAPAPPLRRYHRALLRAYGSQGWWPGRSRFEVIVGAILTQGVSWSNVEKAIRALRGAGLLAPRRMRRAPARRIATLVRPAGYFNQKARALAAFVRHLDRAHAGSLGAMLRQPTDALRRELLALPGLGPETADAILLYAAGRPVFVVDAYARRILARHGAIRGDEGYEDLRRRMESALPPDPALLNDMHALLVRVGKERCRRRQARCDGCPLRPFLPAGGRPRPTHAGGRRAGASTARRGIQAAGSGRGVAPATSRRRSD